MKYDIILLVNRLKYLKENSSFYYSIFSNHIEKITEKIFETFPYKLLIENYKDLLLCEEKVFRPKILKNKEIKDISQNYMMFFDTPGFFICIYVGISCNIYRYSKYKYFKKIFGKIGLYGRNRIF